MTNLDKKFSIIILTLTLITASFLYAFSRDQKKELKVTKLSSTAVNGSSKQITDYSIDSITTTDSICTINGWAVVKGVNSLDVVPSVLLVDDENNFYKVKTRIVQRQDVTKKINDGKTYNNSGILSKFSIEDLDKKRKYKLVIQVKIGKTVYTKLTDVQLPLK